MLFILRYNIPIMLLEALKRSAFLEEARRQSGEDTLWIQLNPQDTRARRGLKQQRLKLHFLLLNEDEGCLPRGRLCLEEQSTERLLKGCRFSGPSIRNSLERLFDPLYNDE